MAKEGDSAMARARQNDGISVIFDKKSPASRSRSRSGSVSSRGRRSNRKNHRSPSSSCSSGRSSSRSRSRSHNRSRSHPRCHRDSSRCGCLRHRGHKRSTARRHDNNAPSDKTSRRSARSRRSSHRRHRDSKVERRSRSALTENKRELAENGSAEKVPVKPALSEDQSDGESPVFEQWVRRDSEKSPSQSLEERPPCPRTSPPRKTISFSINNSFAKPSMLAQPAPPPVDTYDSSKPYGSWLPVRSARKHKKSH